MQVDTLTCLLVGSATVNLLVLLKTFLPVLIANCKCGRLKHPKCVEYVNKIVLVHVPTCILLIVIIVIFLQSQFFVSPLLYWSPLVSLSIAVRLGWQLFHIGSRLSDVDSLSSHKLELYNLFVACVCTAFICVTQQNTLLAFYLVLLDFLYMFTDCSTLLTINKSKKCYTETKMSLCVAGASLTFTILVQGLFFVATVIFGVVNGDPASLSQASLPMFAFFCIYYTCSNTFSIVVSIRNLLYLRTDNCNYYATKSTLEWTRKATKSEKLTFPDDKVLPKVLNNNANVNSVKGLDKTSYKQLVTSPSKTENVSSISEDFASEQLQHLMERPQLTTSQSQRAGSSAQRPRREADSAFDISCIHRAQQPGNTKAAVGTFSVMHEKSTGSSRLARIRLNKHLRLELQRRNLSPIEEES